MPMGKYDDFCDLMRAGDVLAFSGKGAASKIIQWRTGSHISHVGCMLQKKHTAIGMTGTMNQLIESTSLDGAGGVSTSRLSTVIEKYDGSIYWLALREPMTGLQNKLFFDFMYGMVGREYDTRQAVKSSFNWLERLLGKLFNRESFDKLFCSELIVGGLKAAGIIPQHINASRVTPAELIRMGIFSSCVQLKGEERELQGFNSVTL